LRGVCKLGLGDVDLGLAFLYRFLSLFDSIAVLVLFRFCLFTLCVGNSTLGRIDLFFNSVVAALKTD
jgi:hypothetical protein